MQAIEMQAVEIQAIGMQAVGMQAVGMLFIRTNLMKSIFKILFDEFRNSSLGKRR